MIEIEIHYKITKKMMALGQHFRAPIILQLLFCIDWWSFENKQTLD